ncbi:hypothetical protein P170DRAFT_435210 [Aspergillus steynii IBT 23096]|uniref:N-acetyltransferase domain-containing protein n=1 Tax=Aspergillus steynii IBT 23096 TaxID=1392250 RepID=A0A2I2GAI9_9EURO|nr:uncharacterized protein P170DRAFT_435210 [Aspergillus steynii IBT 23096]PLB49899.1 hypothetical protein P170DRAFT_435210 [Aspergillus steynii IBT 23096]
MTSHGAFEISNSFVMIQDLPKMSLPKEPTTWNKDEYFISTDKSLISLSALNSAFDSDMLYWSKPYPEDILQEIINHSFCFGLYEAPDTTEPPETNSSSNSDLKTPRQIGFARLVTDYITFAYLTDLYVLPEYQGKGFGGWLIDCVDELVKPLPHLRWIMLRTSSVRSQESYKQRMSMEVLDSPDASQDAVTMGRRGRANLA